MPDKRIRFKLSPELADGEHWTIANTKEALLGAISAWADDALDDEGYEITVKTIAMSDEEADNLPEL